MADTRPYKPSWLDVLIDWVSALKIPPALFYILLYLLCVFVVNLALWLEGYQDWWVWHNYVFFDVIWLPLGLGYIHLMERVARRSIEDIRPVLELSPAEFEALRYRFVTMPFWPVLLITLAGLGVGLYFSFQWREINTASTVVWSFISSQGYTFLPLWFYVAYRQVSQIDSLYKKVTKLNLFNLQPLYGLARVAMLVGVFLIVVVNINFFNETYYGSITQAPETTYLITVGGIAAAVAVFIIPVLGIHNRIEKDKNRLLSENAEQINSLRNDIQKDMESRNFKNIDGLEKGLSALLKVRESVGAVPTWPWSPGTFRSFSSAIVLPIVVWVLQRVLTPFFAVP